MRKDAGKGMALLLGMMSFILLFVTCALSASPSPQRGGILKITDRYEPPALNPMATPSTYVFTTTAAVFNGLVMIDPTQEEVSVEKVVPSLAERWTVSPEGETYTFYLRKGVKFHDGKPFTARDAKYSLDFFADRGKSAQAPMVEMMDRVEILDDHTIRVHLKYPHVPFLLYLTFPYCVMLPAHLAHVNPKTSEFLVGTGPFKFKRRVPGKVWIYERNPEYFLKGLPYLDGVEAYPIARETAIDAFCAGRLSMAGNLRYGIDSKTSLDKIRKHVPEAVIRLKPAGVLRGVIFNVAGSKGRKGPWQDVRVRRAMTLVADFPGCIMAVQGTPELGMSSGLVPPYVPTGLPWKEVEKLLGIDKPMDQRIQEAKKLMKEAGYPDGFKVEMICRGGRVGGVYLPAAEFLIDNWRKYLNIQINLKPLETAVLFPRRDTGDFDVMFEGTTSKYGGTPEEILCQYVSTGQENHGKWSNQEYDRLYSELIRETDAKKRQEMSVKMQRLFLAEVPLTIVVAPSTGTAYRPTLHGHVMQAGHTTWACIDRIWMEK